MATRDIVCLANSRKYNGKCVAGKDVNNHAWVRPVSKTGTGELSVQQIRFPGGTLPGLLDIIRIPLDKYQPKSYQPENWVISAKRWERVGIYPVRKLDELCDQTPILWDNNHPSKDRISCKYIEEKVLGSSLLFIRVYNVKITREDKDYEDKSKKTIKASFSYNQIHYTLSVTDPDIEKKYLSKKPGTYSIDADRVYMCISLGEPYERDNCCYKLVAAIITANSVEYTGVKESIGTNLNTSQPEPSEEAESKKINALIEEYGKVHDDIADLENRKMELRNEILTYARQNQKRDYVSESYELTIKSRSIYSCPKKGTQDYQKLVDYLGTEGVLANVQTIDKSALCRMFESASRMRKGLSKFIKQKASHTFLLRKK